MTELLDELSRPRPPVRAARAASKELQRLRAWLVHINTLEDPDMVMHCTNRALLGDPAP